MGGGRPKSYHGGRYPVSNGCHATRPRPRSPPRLASMAARPRPCFLFAFFKVSNPRARGVRPRCPCPVLRLATLALAACFHGALAPVPCLAFAGPAVAAAIGALGEEPISLDFISFQGREGGRGRGVWSWRLTLTSKPACLPSFVDREGSLGFSLGRLELGTSLFGGCRCCCLVAAILLPSFRL
jgi:hypothetical protein